MGPAQESSRSFALLRRATAAAKQGHKQMARETLRQLLAEDPDNEQALMWAAALADNEDEAVTFLTEVLRVNPNNIQAVNTLALSRLAEAIGPPRQVRTPPPPAAAERPVATTRPTALKTVKWTCPLCETELQTPDKDRCPECGAVIAIELIERLRDNRGTDDDKLEAALERWKQRAGQVDAFTVHLNIARALLNLHRSAEALPHLRRACSASPVATGLKMLYGMLEQRRVVLAVDDSATVRRIAAILLDRAGYLPLLAHDGMEGIELLKDWKPALILADVDMPRMDGFQLCKTVRATAHTRDIPVVLITSRDGIKDKVRGALAGATEYLVKPFSEEQLLELVQQYASPVLTY